MAKLTILGLGNILMRDEGAGVRLMEAVRNARAWPADLEFIDGGAGGLGLLNIVEESQRLLVFDAADMGLAPGESRVISPEQVEQEDVSQRLSMHQVSFVEVLGLCRQFFRCPPATILAVQVHSVEFGRDLSEELLAAWPELLAAALALVEQQAGSIA